MAQTDRKADQAAPERQAGERPKHIKAPAHLSKNPPLPEPDPLDKAEEIIEKNGPTRYGDWEHKGLAIDF